MPRAQVLPLLRARKRWSTPREYVDFLGQHPLGPNVTAFLGHSDLRTATMGLDRATRKEEQPTKSELDQMERWLVDALDSDLLSPQPETLWREVLRRQDDDVRFWTTFPADPSAN